MKVNLHTHSYYSDGIFSPDEVVKFQSEAKVEVMALTDHDSVDGVDEAMAAGERYGVKVISGIELSSYSSCEIHILGYNFDYKNPEFYQSLQEIKNLRKTRILKTVEKLHELGVPVDENELDLNGANLGRVHIARQMVKQGIVSSVSDAFYLYLGSGKKAYVSGYRLSPMEAVKLIKEFGGVPVLAHPVYIPKDKQELLISGLLPYGLEGIECYYSSYNETDIKRFLDIAKKHRLISTAGTDFHDKNLYLSPSYTCDKLDSYSLKKLKLIK